MYQISQGDTGLHSIFVFKTSKLSSACKRELMKLILFSAN